LSNRSRGGGHIERIFSAGRPPTNAICSAGGIRAYSNTDQKKQPVAPKNIDNNTRLTNFVKLLFRFKRE
jgi:hypothetical protein